MKTLAPAKKAKSRLKAFCYVLKAEWDVRYNSSLVDILYGFIDATEQEYYQSGNDKLAEDLISYFNSKYEEEKEETEEHKAYREDLFLRFVKLFNQHGKEPLSSFLVDTIQNANPRPRKDEEYLDEWEE